MLDQRIEASKEQREEEGLDETTTNRIFDTLVNRHRKATTGSTPISFLFYITPQTIRVNLVSRIY